jgi:precorrin-2 dehydrogenase/sirohydrochlorin ferrochelatase
MLELMSQKSIPYTIRNYETDDLEGMDIVIAAVNDQELQKRVFLESNTKKILCNAVDLAEYCHFIFPSVIRRGDLIVSVSTSGASPAFAKHFKRFLEKLIPTSVAEFLVALREKRASLPKGKERMKLLDEMASVFVDEIAKK